MHFLSLPLLLALLSFVAALSTTGNRLLVVLEETSKRDSYSQLWRDLESRGYVLKFESPKSPSLSLFTLGERSHDHVLLLPPSSKAYGPSLTPNLLLDFIKADGNVLLALTGERPTPSAITSFLFELDIHLPPDRHAIAIDHFFHDTLSSPEDHDVLVVPPPAQPIRQDAVTFFRGDPKKPIALPRAVPHTLGPHSPLLVPILRARPTSYTYNPRDGKAGGVDEELWAAGAQMGLVGAMQARNSARLVVLSSAEMLEDKWFGAQVRVEDNVVGTGNRLFAEQVTGWAFKETGVLKVGRLEHHLFDMKRLNDSNAEVEELNPAIYRIKNDVTFIIELSEYSSTHLIPYRLAPGDEIQVEFSMLSPFVRLNLRQFDETPNSTLFGASFTLPDQHGIFNFRVNYKRPFLTNVDEKRQVTVRHFAHDEWPRSFAISAAWTWIAGIGVTVVGWCAFVAVWLYSEPVREVSSKKRQ